MFAPSFHYHRVTTIDEARALMTKYPGARLLAGGHSLLPLLKLRLAAPDGLIDLARVDALKGIAEQDGRLRIGAMTTHAEVAASEAVRAKAAVLAEAAGRIGDPAVRNRGTIGGSIAHADPGADLPAVLVALDAGVEIAGASGARTVSADAFFRGLMETALEPGEIVTSVLVPPLAAGTGAAYVKFAHPASRYAVVGIAAAVTVAGGTVSASRVVAGGLVPRPARLAAVEEALAGQPAKPSSAEAASAHAAAGLGDEVIGDLFASAEYRRAVAATFVAEAIAAALARAA